MMNSNRKRDIERKANEFRRSVGINSMGIANIFELCNNKFYLIRYPIGTDSVLGATFLKDNDYIVFSNSSSVLSREIFTVAHEIGHIVLEHVNLTSQAIHDVNLDETDQKEADANHFAACLLMPKEKVDEFVEYRFKKRNECEWSLLEIAAVMSTFNVSFDVALIRLNYLGFIDSQQYENLIHSKTDTKVSSLLRAIGVSPDLCFPQEIKSIPVDFLQWVRYNYQNGLVPVETFKKAIDYLDNVSINDFSITAIQEEDSFDLDKFLEEEDE